MPLPTKWGLPECPNGSGELRINCPCSSCSEHREVLREKIRKEEEDRIWESREQSRRVDEEYRQRRMG